MDIKSRILLQRHQQDIIEDLDVTYILDELFTKNAISTADFDHIYTLPGRIEKVRYLIDVILQNGTNEVYEAFVDSLSKDYRWLWEKLAVENNEPMLHDSFEDSLSRGDVPRLPDHYVRRMAVEEKVAEKLNLLTRHNFLVLHGMSGSGKTSIVTSVLRANPNLITTNFNGVVFWVNLGNTKTEDDIIAQQNKLYRRTSSIYSHNSYMNSSISMSSMGSNADCHSLSSYDWTWIELRDKLKTQFADQAIKESLLILDEVNDKKCVEAFDIGCKILITTRDTEVVANFRPQIIKIENNFTEKETLELFASCLDVNVNQLPRQAKKLHEICKGSPFHIALIGAQLAENKERLNHDPRAWKYYLNTLERKEFFFSTRNNYNPMKTIEMCINSLKPNILPLFKMLTILPDNAKVSATVLAKLWNKDVNEVESIMKQLRSKSLIIEFYDPEQRNYIYEIHDLIMNYLRTCSNEEEVKRLHAEFLKSYNYDDNTPVEIVDDGYIAFYIGYHILNTKNYNNMWKLFNKLFMDLKFLGNKVRLTGQADLILDLGKYENYIADNEFDKELLYSIKSYLITHGIDLYRYPCTDIVQSILQHENKGRLFTKALQVAHENCAAHELYFEFLHEQNVEEIKPSNIDVKENITSVCFLGDYALVGTLKGAIKFFHISTNKLKKELPGTDSAIKWIGADVLLTGTGTIENTAKVWYLDASYVSQNTKNGKVRLTTKFDVSFVHTLTPQTPSNTPTNGTQSTSTTPKRHQSFVNHKDVEKKVAKKTMSLDRHSLKPLVLKGICNGNGEEGNHPLLVVVDDKNNIQIMRGRKVLTEIPAKVDEQITIVKISPCNQYIVYGLKSGNVIKYTLRTKESKAIIDVNSAVQYLRFVNSSLLMVAGKNRCLMAYRLTSDGDWEPEMLQRGNSHLGSQEILNDIQGKRKISPSEHLSNSGSDSSIASKDRFFPNGDTRSLSTSSGLVECFWIHGRGLLTIEHNATIKLWSQDLKLVSVLYGRQIDVRINCAAFQKNILVICDDNKKFLTFALEGDGMNLQLIQEYKLNSRIVSCDLTSDGYILAMGLDTGEVVVWYVKGKRQLRLLKQHKTKVQSCSFSPVPDRLFRSSALHSPSPQNNQLPSYAEGDDEQPPLVLVTMASEIVWWNVTYLINMRANKAYWRTGWNVVTPVASPMESRTELTVPMEKLILGPPSDFFFANGTVNAQDCWKAIWKKKTYKEGSKRKEILACIKLSGMNAKKLIHDDKFSCFVTVDNPGHIHIMNVMRSSNL
ncbi:apoptotic protease-activating factor 1-like isoform X3 [Hyposmocoma kahamanoa]|uniref:apoptotic protease-activating factor 1-like isoform X3 n=1 Tax=Hyposmocoma kahamanoa TaxID=1477025 RepID=UPI000E6D5FB8|nr:apoptotic protease-activating factor 1-like isoform X3 [Hyposmocoma kahamanoa]